MIECVICNDKNKSNCKNFYKLGNLVLCIKHYNTIIKFIEKNISTIRSIVK